MSGGRVALPSKNRATYDSGLKSVPPSSEGDAKLNAKYQRIVETKISLRPGDNTDLLEALGLRPTTHTPTPAGPGRWPHTGVEV